MKTCYLAASSSLARCSVSVLTLHHSPWVDAQPTRRPRHRRRSAPSRAPCGQSGVCPCLTFRGLYRFYPSLIFLDHAPSDLSRGRDHRAMNDVIDPSRGIYPSRARGERTCGRGHRHQRPSRGDETLVHDAGAKSPIRHQMKRLHEAFPSTSALKRSQATNLLTPNELFKRKLS